jgi:hypothetical protein
MSPPVLAIAGSIPFLFLFPALLGAFICDSWSELSPTRVKDALFESPHYFKTTFFSMLALTGALAAIWLPDESSPFWRVPLAIVGGTLAGALIGLLRRDAESVVEQ